MPTGICNTARTRSAPMRGVIAPTTGISAASELVQISDVVERQLRFFSEGRSGCGFAAVAAKRPLRYGWRHHILKPSAPAIAAALVQAIESPATTMVSLLFPSVKTMDDLLALIDIVSNSPPFFVESDRLVNEHRCIAIRATVGNSASWVTGFGPFNELPATRQAPCVELTLRTKARPNYKLVMKESKEGTIHLADLDLLGDLSWAVFQALWHKTMRKTAALLGHSPDIRSAAKTTFALPIVNPNDNL